MPKVCHDVDMWTCGKVGRQIVVPGGVFDTNPSGSRKCLVSFPYRMSEQKKLPQHVREDYEYYESLETMLGASKQLRQLRRATRKGEQNQHASIPSDMLTALKLALIGLRDFQFCFRGVSLARHIYIHLHIYHLFIYIQTFTYSYVHLFTFLSRFKIHKQQPHPVTFPTTKKRENQGAGQLTGKSFCSCLELLPKVLVERCENPKPNIFSMGFPQQTKNHGGVQDFDQKTLGAGCFHGLFSATGKVKR